MHASPSRLRTLQLRSLSTLVLWTVIVVALFAPNRNVGYLALPVSLGFIGLTGFGEFARMFSRPDRKIPLAPFLITGSALLAINVLQGWIPAALQISEARTLIVTLLLFWLLTTKLLFSNRVSYAALAIGMFGWFYIFWLLGFLIDLYRFPDVPGNWLLFYFILVTKGGDLGAYVVGNLFGRHKMVPQISAGKTWEGLIGAFVVPTALSAAAVYWSGSNLVFFQGWHCVVLGVLLGGLSVIGDLIASLLKRENDLKDSGRFLPGIGGCLDLMDSLLFNAPIFYIYCRLTLAS